MRLRQTKCAVRSLEIKCVTPYTEKLLVSRLAWGRSECLQGNFQIRKARSTHSPRISERQDENSSECGHDQNPSRREGTLGQIAHGSIEDHFSAMREYIWEVEKGVGGVSRVE